MRRMKIRFAARSRDVSALNGPPRGWRYKVLYFEWFARIVFSQIRHSKGLIGKFVFLKEIDIEKPRTGVRGIFYALYSVYRLGITAAPRQSWRLARGFDDSGVDSVFCGLWLG